MSNTGLTVLSIPIESIDWRRNLRYAEQSNAKPGLTESIKSLGLLVPIKVSRTKEPERFNGLDGFQRVLSLRSLGISHVDAIVMPESDDDPSHLAEQVAMNRVRSNLPPSTVSKAIFIEMQERNCTSNEAHRRLGVSPSSGSKSKGLLRLDAEVLALVDKGDFPVENGYLLSLLKEHGQQRQLAKKIIEQKLKRSEVERLVNELRDADMKPDKARRVKVSMKAADGISITVSGANLDLKSFILALQDLVKRAKHESKRGLTLFTFEKLCIDLGAKESTS